jgi:predicted transcriptional regulator
MTSTLEAIAFLARSENRVRALATLVADPCDRNELADLIGISRVTAQRILDDFVQHGWATETDRTYRATDLGSIVSEEFEALLDTVETTQRLAAVAPWLPPEFDVDMRWLTDARITLPAHSNPLAPVRRSAELMGDAASVRGLGAGIAPDALRVNHDSVVNDGQSFEVVFSEDVLDVIAADPRMSGWMREMLAAGALVYSHEDVGFLLGEFDGEVVGLGVSDGSGIPRGFVESEAEEMLDWFEATFEQHRSTAELVTADTFTP